MSFNDKHLHALVEFLQTHHRTEIPGHGAVYERLPWARGSSTGGTRRLERITAMLVISIALSTGLWWVI